MTKPHPTRDGALDNLFSVVKASLDLVGHVVGNVERLVTDVHRDSMRVGRESEALYVAASARASQISAAIRATPRFTRIVTEALRIIASYRFHRTKSGFLESDVATAELEALHRANAIRLRDLCLELRGGVLKLGQFLSCRMDLLPPAYVEELSTLQDRVPPVDSAAIVDRIEAELGRPIGELFARFETEAIAAASLAQVHAATLHDGTEVAVKVQVPGIEEIIDIDLAALRVVAGVLGDLVPGFDIATISRELARSVHRELDFVAEANNATDFAAHFATDDRVVVPAILADQSSRRVLTMTRIEGHRLIDFLDGCGERGDDGARDRDQVFAILIECFCRQILGDGLFHSDPHPGNFLVCDGPRLAVLDFGSVERFGPEIRHAYAELAGAALGRDQERMAELLRIMGFRTRSGDASSLLEFAEMMLELFRDGASHGLEDIDPREQLERALILARENPIVSVPQDFVMLGRVFGALAGLLFHYRPRVELFRLIAPHLAAALAASQRSRRPEPVQRKPPASPSSTSALIGNPALVTPSEVTLRSSDGQASSE